MFPEMTSEVRFDGRMALSFMSPSLAVNLNVKQIEIRETISIALNFHLKQQKPRPSLNRQLFQTKKIILQASQYRRQVANLKP